ncbi:unnamed protein product [Thelazia callipaeda]|uniref:ATP-dependent RNA helicase DHX30 n=1 Tax=Thelazia callipaeda TaxID=103827 RepID=A0A0N5CMJ2_THECL|nr:unnamed protein product [Thelazia callipaeda]
MYSEHSDFNFGPTFEINESEDAITSFEESIRKQLYDLKINSTRGYLFWFASHPLSDVRNESLLAVSDMTKIILPPMKVWQRTIVHRSARHFGLNSYSIGSGCNRRVVVLRFPYVDLCTYTNAKESEPIVLNKFQKQSLAQFLTAFPLNYSDIELYLRSGIACTFTFDRKARSVNGRWNVSSRPMLIPPCTSKQPSIENFRRSLPTYAMRKEILKAIRNHKVTMIVGGTGCGKTTQIPQFLLEDAAERQQKIRIFCTQPRRLPVLAVSARVARERNEKLGSTVGYHIRLEQKVSEQTVLTYCTSGVLLRMMTSDVNASNISHIILDEIHEREQKTDYLLIALREALKNRSDLKVILMSATMNESRSLFKRYFGQGNVLCLEIPSTLHRVEMFYLPEILALTDYKHASSFTGGTFFGKTARSLNDSATFNSFPQVDEFRSENFDYSKTPSRRSGKKKGRDEVTSGYEVTLSPSVPFFSGAIDQQYPLSSLSSTAFTQFNNHQLYSQISVNSQQGKSSCMSYNGQSNLTDMYNKMNIGSNEQNSPYQEPAIYDGFQVSNYSYPPPNYAYATQILSNSYGMMATCDRPQITHETYQMMPSDCQIYHPTTEYLQFPKYNIPLNKNDGCGKQRTPNKTNFCNQRTSSFPTSNAGPVHRDAFLCNQKYYVSNLRDRPPYFDPLYVEVLRRTNLDTVYLVDSYMMSGGEQWSESVDMNLTVAIISYCMDSPVLGSILVFLPGYEDILAVREKVIKMVDCCTRPAVFTLHSQMSSQDQQRVFDPVGHGYRKVILSTNIAEASLTIDDVIFVIDCGRAKEKIYDHSTRVSQLRKTWIAKSNAEQRAGRAGRCRDGFCFRMYTTEDYARMDPIQLPEMKRSAIYEVCLHAKMFAPKRYSVRQFLLNAPEPPSPLAIDQSIKYLEQIGALFKNRPTSSQMSHSENSCSENPWAQNIEPDLTDLGCYIAQLPLCPQMARFLLFGICLKCLSPALTLVATLSHRDPFVLPSGGREERTAAVLARDKFAGFDYSDHMTFLRVYNAFIKLPVHKQMNFCMSRYLSLNAMRMIVAIRQQLFLELQKLRLLPNSCLSPDDPDFNRYSDSWPMIQACIVSGSYPGIGFTRSGGQMRKIRTSNEVASLHFASAIKRQTSTAGASGTIGERLERPEPTIQYLAFQELSKIGDALTLRTVTAVPPLTVLLFAGPIRLKREVLNDYSIGDELGFCDDETDSNVDECVFALDPWLDMQLVLKLRVKLMTYFLSVMKQPDRSETEEDKELLATINEILVKDHRRSNFPECLDLPRFHTRSPNCVIELANERPTRCRQYSEEHSDQETSDYLTSRNQQSKQWNEISSLNNQTNLCAASNMHSTQVEEGIHNDLSYHAVAKNDVAGAYSNETSSVVNISSPSLPPEDEQVPEDPCMGTSEEMDDKNRSVLMTDVNETEEDLVNRDMQVLPEKVDKEEIERRDNFAATDDANISDSGRGRSRYLNPCHFRSEDQRIRRIFRQFVNRSRPQAVRVSDNAVEVEENRSEDQGGVRRRRESRRKDWHWRKNSPACNVAPSDTYRMPRAYFRGGGRGKPDLYRGPGFHGRRAPKKESS